MDTSSLAALVLLGNPGSTYHRTRHNVARRLVDHASLAGISWQGKFQSEVGEWSCAGSRIRVLVPDVYMNESGRPVEAMRSFYKLTPPSICVAHDDSELPIGVIGLRRGGGLAGHNGLKSVAKMIGSQEFWRLRIGVGRPVRGDLASHVLGNFAPLEEAWLQDIVDASVTLLQDACEHEVFERVRGGSKLGKRFQRQVVIEQALS